eukprot:m.211607 g.211607  ORF g.211607 m.211607 type:complete len:173 (-) comp10138_c5_seq85:583-1101(-)
MSWISSLCFIICYASELMHSVQECNITAAGLQTMLAGARCTSLEVLNLSGNAIGDAGACIIAEWLPGKAGMWMLFLFRCGISATGALALLHAFTTDAIASSVDLANVNHIRRGLANTVPDTMLVAIEAAWRQAPARLLMCAVRRLEAVAAIPVLDSELWRDTVTQRQSLRVN